MNVAFLGDSITFGYGLGDPEACYTKVLCRENGWVEENYGICGTLMAKAGMNTDDTRSYVDRLPLIFGADYAVVFGGTNDYFWSDHPIEPKEGEGGVAYFRDAVTNICTRINEARRPGTTLIVTPYPHNGVGNFLGGATHNDSSRHDTDQVNYNGHILADYVRVLKQVSAKHRIACLDLHEDFGFEWHIHTSDGCHPNEGGHRLLASVIGRSLRELMAAAAK